QPCRWPQLATGQVPSADGASPSHPGPPGCGRDAGRHRRQDPRAEAVPHRGGPAARAALVPRARGRGVKVTDTDAGRVYEIHQSDIAEYQLCPERARAKWFGEVEVGPTDATAAGTAAHAGIETLILGGDWSDALGALHGAWAL